MNRIINEVKKIIEKNMKSYLPQVKAEDLEEQGTVYYMNGKNGTEFDWYINDKLSDFMVFYNDKENLGAVKATLYTDGALILYLYDENGKHLAQKVDTRIDAAEADLLQLAVLFRTEADDKKIWDAALERISTDMEIDAEKVKEFQENERYYSAMKNRMNILRLEACVSKKITQEGWKVGYMERNEPHDEQDSGWSFFAGDEDDAYTSDYHNIELVRVGYVWQQFDADIFRYIDQPIGARLIRISSHDFEIDQNTKEIYMEKRN